MKLKPGMRAKSAVCDTQIVVVRPGNGEAVISCGGVPMLDIAAEKPADGQMAPGHDTGALVGKRYVDEKTGAEVLCAKGGAGGLSINGNPLTPKETKALPASD